MHDHLLVSVLVKDTATGERGFGSIPGPVKLDIVLLRLPSAAMFLQNCIAQAQCRGDGHATNYTPRRNTAIYHKDLIFLMFSKLNTFTLINLRKPIGIFCSLSPQTIFMDMPLNILQLCHYFVHNVM